MYIVEYILLLCSMFSTVGTLCQCPLSHSTSHKPIYTLILLPSFVTLCTGSHAPSAHIEAIRRPYCVVVDDAEMNKYRKKSQNQSGRKGERERASEQKKEERIPSPKMKIHFQVKNSTEIYFFASLLLHNIQHFQLNGGGSG